MNTSDLEEAEKTAIDAAEAILKVFDFAIPVLRELSRLVADNTSLSLHEYDQVHHSLMDEAVVTRFIKSHSRIHRFVYSLFLLDKKDGHAGKAKSESVPFILVSLINSEDRRPPCIVYGVLKRLSKAESMTDKNFAGFFMFWLNENLNKISLPENMKGDGWELKHELKGNVGKEKLQALVSFQVKKHLFDITEDNLGEQAEIIAGWFGKHLNLPN